ncbi:cytochrome P450 [Leucogyrophana mollusca]|uniref:Cytochrome P450 n=1 Tax=Leucogyrophana mollusca TaxID=85980 RepID=A0ACB8BUS1_9AGAM|nr:cytochrome P450 [Leucogyrophana mollusca]
MFYTLHLALGFSFVYFVRFVHQRLSAALILRNIPGPKSSSWIWGEEQNLYYSSAPGSLYLEWHRNFGKVVKFTGAFGHQVLSITDPRAITFILGEGVYQFPKPDGVRAWFGTLLGEGILWIEGKEAHEKQRRAVGPALSPQSARNMTTVFYDNATRMATQWHRLFDANQSDDLMIEMTNWAGRYALDTIGRAAFSYDFDCLRGQPHALAETLDSLTNHEKSRTSFYMRALFWLAPWILHVGKKGQMIRKTRKELGELATNILKDAKLAADPTSKTLMSLMLKADKLDSVEQMDEEHIAAQMRTIISAGYEPVSAALSWIFYELATNPQRQQAIREEVANAGDPSYDELNNNYPLLDAFFLETLRIHPPVLENHHQAAETVSVPLAEPLPGTTDLHLIIPKGTILGIPVNVIQKDPMVWGPDADVFRPERWSQRNFRGTRDLFAFSAGPRGCLGRNFAITEIKALMVTLLRSFSFSCPYDIEAFQSFVIRPRVAGQGPSSLPLLVRRLSE